MQIYKLWTHQYGVFLMMVRRESGATVRRGLWYECDCFTWFITVFLLLLIIMDNVHHPLHTTISKQRSSFSNRLLSLPCSTDRLRKSFVPHAVRLFDSSQFSKTHTLWYCYTAIPVEFQSTVTFYQLLSRVKYSLMYIVYCIVLYFIYYISISILF